MTHKEMKIENKLLYCNARSSDISNKDMCNAILFCGYAIHGRPDKATPGFTATDKIGKHQVSYYNDTRKQKLENKIK